MVITVNQGVRGGRVIELKKTVDTAVQSCPTVKQVFVAMRTENPVIMTDRDVPMEEVRNQSESHVGHTVILPHQTGSSIQMNASIPCRR